VTKPPSTTIEEIANTMSAAAARAMKGLREVSDAIAELREAELMLKGLAASRAVAVDDDRKSGDGVNTRPAYRVDDNWESKEENLRIAYRPAEAAKLLGVSRKTIHRRIAEGKLASTKELGGRLISVESIRTALLRPDD
jgi:excisionase family DNA binding protein